MMSWSVSIYNIFIGHTFPIHVFLTFNRGRMPPVRHLNHLGQDSTKCHSLSLPKDQCPATTREKVVTCCWWLTCFHHLECIKPICWYRISANWENWCRTSAVNAIGTNMCFLYMQPLDILFVSHTLKTGQKHCYLHVTSADFSPVRFQRFRIFFAFLLGGSTT